MSHRAFNACWKKYNMFGFGDTMPHVIGLSVCRPYEEFRADFVIIGRRALTDEDSANLLPLFKLHFAANIDQKLCERHLKLYRGAFDIQTATIKSIVGAAFILTEPYALYPTGQYMGPAERKIGLPPVRSDEPEKVLQKYNGFGTMRRPTGGSTRGGSWT